jgi:hypothetical protein
MRNELNEKIDAAKSNFNKAVSIKNNLLLTVEREARNSAWEELYYFSPIRTSTGKLQRLWDAYKATKPQGAAEIEACIGQIIVAASVLNTRIQEKEDAKNAPAPVKVVPPNQATLAAALADTRANYISRICVILEAAADNAFATLAQHGWDLYKAAPSPRHDAPRSVRLSAFARQQELERFTSVDGLRPHSYGTNYRCRRSDLAEFIKCEAERIGGHNFDSFVCKLTGKIEAAAKTEGNDNPLIDTAILKGLLWDGCTLTVTLNGGTQTWVTQCIINRSVLGKLFNQWPTRRSS